MKKSELVKAIGKKTDYTTASVKEMLAALAEIVTAGLRKDGKVEIPGIVILKLVKTKARKAGLRTIFGETRKVAAKPAGLKLKARAKKTLKDAVIGGKKGR